MNIFAFPFSSISRIRSSDGNLFVFMKDESEPAKMTIEPTPKQSEIAAILDQLEHCQPPR